MAKAARHDRRASGRVAEHAASGVKVKTESWKEANQHRHKLFEGRHKPEPDPRYR